MSGNRVRLLGVDLGASSAGWAIVHGRWDEAAARAVPGAVDAVGSRVFDAGVEGTPEDIAQGKDQSRAVARREARSRRRQTERRERRERGIFALLQAAGLLPGEADTGVEGTHAVARTRTLAWLDARLRGALVPDKKSVLHHTLPYFLRARALDEKLEPWALGRALFQLSQRRGFQSNRKSPPKKDEEDGVVKTGIGVLRAEMDAARARTLGEYLASLDPRARRIRCRYTSREMYEEEFGKIWARQREHHPDLLTDDLRRRLHRAIFHQRPLKSAKHLIGACELYPTRKRAAWGLLLAQRLRYLQKLNDLKISDRFAQERPLDDKERALLRAAFEGLDGKLDKSGDLSFAQIRKILGLKKDQTLNLERGGEKKIPGNRTAHRLRAIFGPRWDRFTDAERDAIVEDVLGYEKADALARRGEARWGLDAEAAKRFGEVRLEPDRCRFSRRALAEIVPLLDRGVSYTTALDELDPGRRERVKPLDRLPPVHEALPALRNPAVERALTELRHVVNAIVREYGKPDLIRVEMARELKNPRAKRLELTKQIRANEAARAKAAEAVARDAGVANPSRDDILKWQLADECGWRCPYTGRAINATSLFHTGEFDVEHIIPFSRCLDDSYSNKTLCHAEENRRVKGNRTPWETYGASEQRWTEILERVTRFNGPRRLVEAKLRRFQMREVVIDDFVARQLNDTRYAARLAVEYLGLLYGWRPGATGRLPVQVSAGGATAFLRRAWGLNGILGDGDFKTRDDHRHHAVDAVVTALTEPGTVKMIARAAERATRPGRVDLVAPEPPGDWESVEAFVAHVRDKIAGVVTSHRVSRRVRGALHKETLYSPEKIGPDGKPCRHVRKQLAKLSAKEVDAIVDDRVREAVRAKLAELGIADPRKAFTLEEHHPDLVTKHGEAVPIHKVRIRVSDNPFPVAEAEHRRRHAVTDTNHHVEIIETKDKKGAPAWRGEVVSMREAYGRKARREPIVKRDHGAGERLVFSLASRDVVEIDTNEGRRLFTVRKISQYAAGPIVVGLIGINDARKTTDIQKSGAWVFLVPNRLREVNCVKMNMDPLGRVQTSHD